MLQRLYGPNGVVVIALTILVLGGCRSANKTPPRVTPYAQGQYPLPQPYVSPQYAPPPASLPAAYANPGGWNGMQTPA